jgi:hypothetical protein
VGPRTITVDDFNAAARNNWSQYPGTPEQAKHQMLDDLLRRDLMLAMADARGVTRDPRFTSMRQLNDERVLTEAISQQIAGRSIPVSNAEIATFYDWSATVAHLQLIYCTQRETAEGAAAQVRAGKPFAEVETRFAPPGLLPPGGDLGELTAGALVDPLDTIVRAAKVGEVVGPIEAPGEGWFVARVLSRQRQPQKAPLEVQRPLLADMLRQRKVRFALTRAFQELREQYRVTLEPGASQALFAILNPAGPAGSSAGDRLAVPEARRAEVMVRYVDAIGRPQVYRLGDAIDDLRNPEGERPAITVLPALEEWLQQQVMRRVVVFEARRRGVDRDPAVERRLVEAVNNAVLEGIYQSVIADAVTASDDDVRAAFQRRATQYQRLDAVKVLHVTFDDSASCATLIQHGMHVRTLREAAEMAGMGSHVVEERVPFPTRNPDWGPMQPNLQVMQAGEWAGPIRTRDGWMAMQLEAREQTAETFEALTPAVRQSLREDALALKRDLRLAALTDSLKRTLQPFEVRTDVLARLPWPPPGATMPGGLMPPQGITN